jgi:hypothetical protein
MLDSLIVQYLKRPPRALSMMNSRINRTLLTIVPCLVLCGMASKAKAQTVSVTDGVTFDVTFNPLPTTGVTTGLTPTSTTQGANYAQGFGPGVGGWGATDPFDYTGAPNDEWAGVYNGGAIYDYATARDSVTILWGTIDDSNMLSFFASGGDLIGTLTGQDMRTAIADNPSVDANLDMTNAGSLEYGADVTIQIDPQSFSSLEVIGSPSLTFEYAYVSSTAASTGSSVPDTGSTLFLLATGLGVIAFVSVRRTSLLAGS